MTVAEASKYTPEEYEKYASYHYVQVGDADAHIWRTIASECVYFGLVSEMSTTGELPEQIPLLSTR